MSPPSNQLQYAQESSQWKLLKHLADERILDVYEIEIEKQLYCLRIAKDEFLTDYDTKHSIINEWHALTNIESDVIFKILEQGNLGDLPFIITEHHTCETLFSYIQKHHLSETQKENISYQLLAAIEGLHEYGIIHTALKPSNVYFDGEYLKISKLGQVRFTDVEGVEYPSPQQTVGYAHPDYIATKIPCVNTDVYALNSIISFIYTKKEQLCSNCITGNKLLDEFIHQSAESTPSLSTYGENLNSVLATEENEVSPVDGVYEVKTIKKQNKSKWILASLFLACSSLLIFLFMNASVQEDNEPQTTNLGYTPVSPQITLPNVTLLSQDSATTRPSYKLSELDRFFFKVFGSKDSLDSYYSGLPEKLSRAEQLAVEEEVAGNIKGANEHIKIFWKRYPDIHKLCIDKKLNIEVTNDFVATKGFSKWDHYYRALRKELLYSTKVSKPLEKIKEIQELGIRSRNCSELFLIVDNRQTKNSCKVSIKEIKITDTTEQSVKLLSLEKLHGSVSGNLKKKDFTMQQNSVVKIKLPPGKLIVKIAYFVENTSGKCDIALTKKVSRYHKFNKELDYLFQLKPHEEKLYHSKAFTEKTIESAIVFDYFLYKMRFSRNQKKRILSQWVGNVLKFNAESVVQLMSKKNDDVLTAINYHLYFPYVVSNPDYFMKIRGVTSFPQLNSAIHHNFYRLKYYEWLVYHSTRPSNEKLESQKLLFNIYVTEKEYAKAMSVLHSGSGYASINKIQKFKLFLRLAKIPNGKKWIEDYQQLIKKTK